MFCYKGFCFNKCLYSCSDHLAMYVTNTSCERLLQSHLSRIISTDNDKVPIISSDGASFELSKFVFSFLSCLHYETYVDKILTPITSANMATILDIINLRITSENKPAEGIIEEARSILGIDLEPFLKPSDSNLSISVNKGQVLEDETFVDNDTPFLSTDKKISVGSKNYFFTRREEWGFQSVASKEMEEESLTETVDSDSVTRYDIGMTTSKVGQQCDSGNGSNEEKTNCKDRVEECHDKKLTRYYKNSYRSEKYRLKMGDPVVEWEGNMDIARSIQCQICGKKFERDNYSSNLSHKNAYSFHYRSHILENSDCDCGISFSSPKQRIDHMLIAHKGHVKCEACTQILNSRESLISHLDTLRECDQCDFKTKECSRGSYFKMKSHKKNVHKSPSDIEITDFECPDAECSKKFPSRGILNSHYNGVHKNSIPCPECGKNVKNLEVHQDSVHRAKKYQCDKCERAFSTISQLNQHDLVDHQGVRYFCRYNECQTKGQEYRDSSNRSTHERKRHGKVFTTTKKRG